MASKNESGFERTSSQVASPVHQFTNSPSFPLLDGDALGSDAPAPGEVAPHHDTPRRPFLNPSELTFAYYTADPHARQHGRSWTQNMKHNFIPSSEILARYGEWKAPSLEEAEKDYERDHGFHKDFPLYSTKPFELRVFGKGCMLYFFWLRYMAVVMGIMALICGFPNTVIFLSGVWYNVGSKGLEPTTIGNYGLVSSNLGNGNLTLLFNQNPALANCSNSNFPCFNVSSGNDFGASQTYQKEQAILALFRADYPYPSGSPASLDSSIPGGLNKQSTIIAMSVLDLLSCIFFFGFCLFFVVKTRRLALKADLGTCTIEDYSVRVENIPPDITRDELVEHFQVYGTIARVDRCHAIYELMGLVRQRRKLLDKLEKDIATLQKAAMKSDKVPEDLETKVLETQYDLALCRRAIRSKQQDKKDEQVSDVVEAYIVFEEEEAKARALAAHTSHTDFYRRFKSLFGIKTVASRRLVRASSPHTSHAISVTEAPEPSDLIWENLEVGMTTRRLFGVFSWSLKALVLIIGFLGTSLAPALKLSLGAWNGGPSVDSCNSYCSYISDNGTPVLNTTGPSSNLLRQDNFYRSCSPNCPSGNNCQPNSSSVITYNGVSQQCGNQTICYECFCRLTVGAGDVGQAFYCSPWASVLGIQVGAEALSVVAIVVVNLVLPYIMEFLSSIEWHDTNSSQSRSVARALIIMFFLNTAVSIMVANAYLPGIRAAMKGTAASKYLLLGIFPDLTPNWFKEVGSALLLSQLTGILIRMAIPLALQLLRWWNVRREKKYQEMTRKKAEAAKGAARDHMPATDSLYLTQREMNEAWEGADFTLAEKYGMHMGVVFITMFFGGTMPLAYLISCCSFSTVYWIEKNFLLRFCKRPIAYSEDLAVLVSELMPWATFWHLIFAAWSFSMIAVPKSGMVTDEIQWVLDKICSGLKPVWDNTNGLTPAQMSQRLAQSNSFHLLLFIFIFILILIAFSIVDEFSFFFGPLFRRTIRKVKKFLKPATDHAFVRGIVGGVQNVGNIAQGAAGKAGSLATTVAATGAGAAKSAAKTAAKGVKKAASVARGNQVVPILSEEDRERLEFEQEARKSQREQQRVSEEAMLDQAVKEHIRAQEEEDDANFEKALADVGPDKDGSRGLDPELAGSDKSIKLAPKLTGIFFMPKFSEAIAQGKLVGQATYHVEDAPLYEDAFLEDDDDQVALEAEDLASKLAGRKGKLSHARMALRKKAGGIVRNSSSRLATGAVQLTAVMGFKKIASGISQAAGKASNLATQVSLVDKAGNKQQQQQQHENQNRQHKEALATPTPQVSVLDVVAHGGAPADASAAERVPEERNTESRARSERVSRLAAPAVATVAEEGTEGNYM